ncbi:hypothetical protein ABK040_009853 [Willaertia magna]
MSKKPLLLSPSKKQQQPVTKETTNDLEEEDLFKESNIKKRKLKEFNKENISQTATQWKRKNNTTNNNNATNKTLINSSSISTNSPIKQASPQKKKIKQSITTTLPFSHQLIKPKSNYNKFIIGITGGNSNEKSEIISIIENLQKNKKIENQEIEIGGENFEEYTHVICLNAKRTLKIIYAIALQIPILSLNWIYESEKVNYFVQENEFYLKEFLRKKPSNGVLFGKRIYFLKFDQSDITTPSLEICEKLIEKCGGKMVKKITKANLIISSQTSKDYEQIIPRNEITEMPLMPIVTVKWLIDTVHEQELHSLDEYKDEYYYNEECLKKEKKLLQSNLKSYLACLRLTTNIDCSTNIIPLYKETKSIVLGRSNSDVDFVIDTENSRSNPVISRRHAKIIQLIENNNDNKVIRWKLIDSSSNGTFVNNIKVKETILCHGDLIAFGHNQANIMVGETVQYVKTKCSYVFETEEIISSQTIMVSSGVNSQEEEESKRKAMIENEELRKQNELMRQEIGSLRDNQVKNNLLFMKKEQEIYRLQKLILNQQPNDTTLQFGYGHKLYVFDTNVLIEKLAILKELLQKENCTCLIPYVVLQEIDKLKSRDDPCGFKSRDVHRYLDDLLSTKERKESHKLIGQLSHQTLKVKDGGVYERSADDVIINCCLYFQKNVIQKNKGHELILLSFDKNMRVKANLNKICSPSVLPFQ